VIKKLRGRGGLSPRWAALPEKTTTTTTIIIIIIIITLSSDVRDVSDLYVRRN
jgi:hypothetical protein